jgi:protoporphyrinogen oxidase
LNVNDPGFPFVGVIEHTNLVSQEEYGNLHVVYLSRYIATENEDYLLPDEEYFQKCLIAVSRMFPDFNQSWIREYRIWRAPFAQPIATKSFSKIIPDFATPYENLFLSSMAQVYPEDRGTNYAVKNGYYLALKLIKEFR